MRKRTQAEIIGWTGTVLILGAYIGSVSGVISVRSAGYLMANILGSAGIMYSSFRKKDLEPVVLNVVWLLVAAISLMRFI